MQDLFSAADLGLSDIQAMVRAMYAVAESDGLHTTELVLVKQFYETCRADAAGLADFKDIVSQPFDIASVAEIVSSAAAREKLLASCLFMAFADGDYSAEERTMIAAIADGLGFGADGLAEMTERVQDYLLQQIAGVRDVHALAEVNRELRS